ncbi:MAG: hypothetical protein RSC90_07385, partial [Clostridia bacterium]
AAAARNFFRVTAPSLHKKVNTPRRRVFTWTGNHWYKKTIAFSTGQGGANLRLIFDRRVRTEADADKLASE